MEVDHENLVIGRKFMPVEISCRANNSLNKGCIYHWHEQIEMYYVRKGAVKLFCNGKEKWLYPGDYAFVNWCEPHRSTGFYNDTIHFIIQMDIKDPIFDIKGIPVKMPNFYKPVGPIVELIEKMIDEYEAKERGYENIVIGCANEILGNLLRHSDSAYIENDQIELRLIKDILTYIHQNFMRHLSLDEVASETGVSKAHMCRMFKKHTSSTILHYINSLKMDHALSLIRGGCSVSESAYAVGFNDYNYFSRCFKKVKGFSPTKGR